mmetsp:Transcript_64331/g.158301  ORF Transcript_64331/g.158301 Transcript_64331/m.158301 type:complete len:511 (+) Transcript_64331:75-1607(+)
MRGACLRSRPKTPILRPTQGERRPPDPPDAGMYIRDARGRTPKTHYTVGLPGVRAALVAAAVLLLRLLGVPAQVAPVRAAHGDAAAHHGGAGAGPVVQGVALPVLAVARKIADIDAAEAAACAEGRKASLLAVEAPLLALVGELAVPGQLRHLAACQGPPRVLVDGHGEGQVHDGPRVAAVHHAEHGDARGEGLDHTRQDVVVEDLAGGGEVDGDHGFVVAVRLVPADVDLLPAVAREVQEERVARDRALDQPIESIPDVGLGGHDAPAVVHQHPAARGVHAVPVVLRELHHLAHVVVAAIELPPSALVVDADEQGLGAARVGGLDLHGLVEVDGLGRTELRELGVAVLGELLLHLDEEAAIREHAAFGHDGHDGVGHGSTRLGHPHHRGQARLLHVLRRLGVHAPRELDHIGADPVGLLPSGAGSHGEGLRHGLELLLLNGVRLLRGHLLLRVGLLGRHLLLGIRLAREGHRLRGVAQRPALAHHLGGHGSHLEPAARAGHLGIGVVVA